MTAQAERIRCDHCTGHYVVDAASDGSPRVRCNECGHVREGVIAGKWTVIGPDGKASSFDSWEELTESRRPSALAAATKGVEEASKVKDLKPPPSEKKSASALLDITPGPKLALADMDSAIDLGEPIVGSRRSRPSLKTTMTAGSGPGSAPGGKLEPLLVKSFSQAPQSQSPTSKVEWAPKIDKSVLPPRVDDTMRTEVAPSSLTSTPNEKGPVTTKAAESSEELSSSSLIEDSNDDDDEEAAPLSLRDVIQDEDDVGENDLEEDAPDPHEKLSLRDMIVVPNTGSQPPPAATTSQRPPKPPTPSQAPVKAASQPPPSKSVAPPARPKALSRPDDRAEEPKFSAPPPSIRPDLDTPEEDKKPAPEKKATEKATEKKATEKKAERKAVAKEVAKEEEAPNRTWMWVAVAAVLLVGIFWRLSQNTEAPKPPETPVATIAPPTPVTTPAMTNAQPPATTPTASAASETISVDTPPAAKTATPASTLMPVPATAPTPVTAPLTTSSAGAAPADSKSTSSESAGSMSELLDQAGSAKRKGDLATAHDLYGKVLAMSPNNVEANGGLGDVAKAQGDLPAAKASYERALASSPTYTPALLGLADVEWDAGNQAEAKRRYAQIVERMGDRAPERAKERSQ